MGRLPGETIANVVSHLAAEGSSHDSDDDKDNGDSSTSSSTSSWPTMRHYIINPDAIAPPGKGNWRFQRLPDAAPDAGASEDELCAGPACLARQRAAGG